MIKYLDLKRINEVYDAEIRQAIDNVLQSGWYLKGEATHHFEEHYAKYIGTTCCVGCGNGLDALTLILRAYIEMGVMKPGDEVIVPANTFIATVLAITANQLTPVFVEPSLETAQIDDSLLEQVLTEKTRALLLVHLYGCCAYTEEIAQFCQRHGLKLIEDNAQAHGCMCGHLRTGSLGDAAGHSFYPGKNLGALGDAGAVTTNDRQLAEIVSELGNYGSLIKYVHDYEGRNSRIDEFQAAILDVKLNHLDEANARRKEIAAYYTAHVKTSDIRLLNSNSDSVWHIFPIFTPRRDQLQQYLNQHGVETQIHYPTPPHLQKCYGKWSRTSLPVTERLAQEELSIPCNQVMTTDEAEHIANLLNQFG